MQEARSLTYLDNAATSFPKPAAVGLAMSVFLRDLAVNPGRSGFDLSVSAGQLVDRVRGKLDRFFNNPARDPNRTVFAANATDALNLAIQGVCRTGDHVITTVLDHNSVLRPLHEMARQGTITWDRAGCDGTGRVDPGQVARLMRPSTRLVVMTHASNVFGQVQPVAAIGRLCRERGVLLLLDTAQTAGAWPVDMEELKVDLLAFTGHKSLMGPTGIGGLLVGPGVPIRSTRWGGTGVRSAEPGQPQEFPYRLEAGTLNTVGIAGLEAGLDWIKQQRLTEIMAAEKALTDRFVALVSEIPGLTVHGQGPEQLAVVSLTLAGKDPEMVGCLLDVDHDMAVRTGLQCAPLAHEALGTAPAGTLRFSFGPFNTIEQIDRAAAALADIAG
jgi:cysteine desulfurase/selenocysteine lyase